MFVDKQKRGKCGLSDKNGGDDYEEAKERRQKGEVHQNGVKGKSY
jgi:hypothetical protein